MAVALLLLSVILGYVLGSLPFGVIVCRLQGKDPRAVGSGRTGGTNVYRTAGLPSALLTIAGDFAKGFVAVRIAAWLLAGQGGDPSVWAMSLAALAAILGHNHSLFLGFRGGAGSTPNAGAVLAFDPLVLAVGLAGAALGLLWIRIASVASLILAALICAGLGWRVFDGGLPPAALTYAVGQLLLVVWALRPNIARLRLGTERRITYSRRALRSGTGES